ncbi:hypothetical protein [Halomonas elongata]|uniref:hypothetical protein n=1 Tax=Halomonas elongata TaxID=2746 RepID=UPI00186B8084|nr:hypothetical protein [Halomonas elongata]MBW5799005.1 hypothetical protein [Halomonas elongata]
MAKLYIHAGSHKTGTSSIQKYLFLNKKWFSMHGFYCYLEGPDNKPHRGNHSWWFDHSKLKEQSAYLREGFVSSISRFSERYDNVVVSSECFSWIFDALHLEKIAKELKESFDEIEVIFYIRRQDRHAVSHYQQAAKSFAEKEFYSGRNGALPDLDDNSIKYLDYYEKLLLWEAAFGRGSVTFRCFDDDVASRGVVSDFLLCLGISPIDRPQDGERANESWGWERTKVFRILNELGVRHQSECGQVIKSFLNDEGKLLPSAEEAYEFYSYFKESNKKLAKSLGYKDQFVCFEEDFSFYPKFSCDTFDETSANQALLNLSKGFLEYIKAKG